MYSLCLYTYAREGQFSFFLIFNVSCKNSIEIKIFTSISPKYTSHCELSHYNKLVFCYITTKLKTIATSTKQFGQYQKACNNLEKNVSKNKTDSVSFFVLNWLVHGN